MGKSHRNVSASSISESQYDKDRGFAREKKAYSHHQISFIAKQKSQH